MANNYNAAPIRMRTPLRKAINNTGGAVAGPNSGSHHGFIVKAMCPGQTIYVGTSAAVATTDGYPMSDGETLVVEGRNANELYFIADADSQAISVLPFDRV